MAHDDPEHDLHALLRSHFLAMASHELRTPLTTIGGFAATLDDLWTTLPDAEKRKFIDIIRRQADRMNRLVEDIFTITRLEGGDYPVRPHQTRVRPLIDAALAGIDTSGLRVSCPPDASAVADAWCLEEIVRRYVSNAVRHGRRPIEVDVVQREQDVEIHVRDSGDGVPDRFRPYLFTKFFQVPDESVPDPTGTGLGLAVVRGLAEAQGGAAEYAPDHGADFLVRLPRKVDSTTR